MANDDKGISRSDGIMTWDDPKCISSSRTSLCDVLRSLIVNNIEHFHGEDENDATAKLFHRTFGEFLEHLDAVEAEVNQVARFASEYDFDRSVPGNGHRSFVAVFDAFVVHSIRMCRQVCIDRGASFIPSVFRRRDRDIIQEVIAHTSVLVCLRVIMRHLNTLRCWSDPGSLFPSAKHSLEDLLIEAGDMDTSSFYGRCLGFQFCESMRKPLKFIALAMASFSDAYYNEGGVVSRTASSLVSCGRYTYYPEKRANRIVSISHRASVHFCKAFWLLQENYFIQQVPGIVCPQLIVNKIIKLAAESLILPKNSVGPAIAEIPVPSSHLLPAPVICRLLSAGVREGQLDDSETGKHHVIQRSPYLIIQVHGGGFVSQSSKSHEVYLRDWASQLNVPIFCVDYSLAPEAPFPRPLEECFYAYCWAVKNCHQLGSTGERICLVGDSAGGNLVLGVTMKAIELGIRRPDAIFAIYTPVLIDFVPSPSRLLCLMDPLLPFGFMLRCLQAYAGSPKDDGADEGNSPVFESQRSSRKMPGEPADVESISKGVGIASTKLNQSDAESFKEISPSDVAILDKDFIKNSDNKEPSPSMLDDDETDNSSHRPDFVDWYILDVDESQNRTVLRSESSDDSVLFEMRKELPEKVCSVANRVMDGITGFLPNKQDMENGQTDKPKRDTSSKDDESVSDDRKLGDAGTMRSLIKEFHKFKVDQSYYLSPYLAPDNLLKQLPVTRFLSLQLDPCLDDAVMMCKRLRELEVQVGLDILDNLPHGFLNFAPVSKDAHAGSRLCVQRLREMLQLSDDLT